MNQITKTNKNLMTFEGQPAWGAGCDVGNEDIIIPRIQLMQHVSQAVKDEAAKAGDFVNSLSSDVIGTANKKLVADKKDSPVDFIAFSSFKMLQTYVNDEYKSSEPFRAEFLDRERYPYEEVTPEGRINRKTTLNFYALLPSEIEAGVAFPYVLTFKGLSTRAGKQLATIYKQLLMFNAPSASVVCQLTASEESNDKGSFYVMKTKKLRNSTAKEVLEAKKWHDAIFERVKTVKVDEPEEKKVVPQSGDIPF